MTQLHMAAHGCMTQLQLLHDMVASDALMDALMATYGCMAQLQFLLIMAAYECVHG